MKKFKLIAFISIPLLIILSIVLIKANNSRIEKDALENIENSIIIKGIEPDSDDIIEANTTDPDGGVIIYNDSFDDLIENTGKATADNYANKDSSSSKISTFDEYKNNIITKLKAKDKRWHLTSHRIRKGENLWLIAKKFNTNYKLIIKANEINNPDVLNPGNTILIPNKNGLKYRIEKYDTLIKISKKYGIEKDTIVKHNKIKNDLIRYGEYIFIPDAADPVKKYAESVKSRNTTDSKERQLASDSGKSRMKFAWPLIGRVTSAFGQRKNPITNKSKFHCGLDISANIGTEVKASADGKAIYSGWKKGYGRVVILKHEKGYITVYAHNKENIVKPGDKVKKGDVIALSGISGAVTGPHLHFEIRKYVTPLNPLRFLN